MAWDSSKPQGTDAASSIDNTTQANFSALDTWASAITDGISAGVSVIFKAYRAALTTILRLRSAAADTQDRFQLTTDGKQFWGSGAVAPARAWDGPRMVRVKKSAAQSTDHVEVTITWDQEDFDTDNMHDNVTNNARLIAPVAGKYLAVLNVAVSTSAANAILRVKNNVGTLQADGRTYGVQAGSSISVPLSLAAAGYVYATLASDTGSVVVQIDSGILANFSLIYLGE